MALSLHDDQPADGQHHRRIRLKSEGGARGGSSGSRAARPDPVGHRRHLSPRNADALVRAPLRLGDRDDVVNGFECREEPRALASPRQQPSQMLRLDHRRHAGASRRSRAGEVLAPGADVYVEDVGGVLSEIVDDRLAETRIARPGQRESNRPDIRRPLEDLAPRRSIQHMTETSASRTNASASRPCAPPSPKERSTACKGRSNASAPAHPDGRGREQTLTGAGDERRRSWPPPARCPTSSSLAR